MKFYAVGMLIHVCYLPFTLIAYTVSCIFESGIVTSILALFVFLPNAPRGQSRLQGTTWSYRTSRKSLTGEDCRIILCIMMQARRQLANPGLK